MITNFKIEFKTEYAAFGESDAEARQEIARILHEVADKIERGKFAAHVRDINGNVIGQVEMINNGE